MANELTWEEIEYLVRLEEELEALINEYVESLSEQELRELQDWLYENKEPPDVFNQPEDLERQRDEARGWLHSWKKNMNVPEAYQDLRLFHGEMRTEVLRIPIKGNPLFFRMGQAHAEKQKCCRCFPRKPFSLTFNKIFKQIQTHKNQWRPSVSPRTDFWTLLLGDIFLTFSRGKNLKNIFPGEKSQKHFCKKIFFKNVFPWEKLPQSPMPQR